MLRLTAGILLAFAATSHAQDWGQLATISSTMGVQGGRLCLGEASRGDIGCPAYAPSVSSTGALTTTAISLTTSGTNWGYLGSNASYLPNLTSNAISTTNISVTTINGLSLTSFGSGSGGSMKPNFPDALLCAGSAGSIYLYLSYMATDGTVNYRGITTNAYSLVFTSAGAYSSYSGSDYVSNCANKSISQLIADKRAFNFTGGGNGATPTGAIMAFDLAACPTGWSEYTPARGRFLRGIDNGAGNDPSGTRVAGSVQEDLFKSHNHGISGFGNGSDINGGPLADSGARPANYFSTSTGGTETRPKNVAVLFCRKD